MRLHSLLASSSKPIEVFIEEPKYQSVIPGATVNFICTAKSQVRLPCFLHLPPLRVFFLFGVSYFTLEQIWVVSGFWSARTLPSSQPTRLCGHVKAAASSPPALWTSTASSRSRTFGLKTPGSTCAPAPTCSTWTRARPSSMSQVRDWHRSLRHRSLSSLKLHLSVYPPVYDSCMFPLSSSLLLFIILATRFSFQTRLRCLCNRMAYLSTCLIWPMFLKEWLWFPALFWSVFLPVCLHTNQTASASSYCPCQTFYARKQYSLWKIEAEKNRSPDQLIRKRRLSSSIKFELNCCNGRQSGH